MFQFNGYEHVVNTCKKFLRESDYTYSQSTENLIMEMAKFTYDSFQQITIIPEVAEKIHSPLEVLTAYVKNAHTEEMLLYYMGNLKNLICKYNEFTFDEKHIDEINHWYIKAVFLFRPKITSEADRLVKDICKSQHCIYQLLDENKEVIYIGTEINNDIIEQYIMSAYYISYATTQTQVDANIYYAYYVGLLKPKYNTEFVETDLPTIKLKTLKFTNPIYLIDRKDKE